MVQMDFMANDIISWSHKNVRLLKSSIILKIYVGRIFVVKGI